jgi:hypothetical protein
VSATHTQDSQQASLHADDSDLRKGATEGAGEDCGNRNAEGALDDSGLPHDDVKIAEDVLGANEDQTQG